MKPYFPRELGSRPASAGARRCSVEVEMLSTALGALQPRLCLPTAHLCDQQALLQPGNCFCCLALHLRPACGQLQAAAGAWALNPWRGLPCRPVHL